MARNYTVEDVETLRSKGGVSYEEAIRLLDKYDGDLASALIELEKSGRMDEKGIDSEKISSTIREWWNKGLETRVLIDRKEHVLADLPLTVMILLVLCAARAMLVGAVILLISGGRIFLKPAHEAEPQPPQPPRPEKKPEEDKPADGFDRITIE